ncbi:MAG: cytochrome c maturation protein CcmE [Desulfonauticus sp.]|nr:cytochrome c maturation protein CcmE [Desulfonauticus sp.]
MKKNYVIAFLFILGAVGYLIFSTVQENKVYFLNVSEALRMGLSNIKQARLFGIVAKEGLKKEDQGLKVHFLLLDKKNKAQSIPVFYKGALPDTFKPGAEVIVEGKMKKNIFQASVVVTKCPSKYKKKERAGS